MNCHPTLKTNKKAKGESISEAPFSRLLAGLFSTRGKKEARLLPSYLPVRRQQRLKPAPGAAWTQVIAPKFLHEFFFSVDHSRPALHFGF